LLFDYWREKLEGALDISISENYSLINSVADPAIVREWNRQGLPSNSASISNGILMKKSNSYPYLIDPQLQGNTWIRKMEAENEIRCIKAADEVNLMKQVEVCLRNTFPVLVEDA